MIGVLTKLSVFTLFLGVKVCLGTLALIFQLGYSTTLKVNKRGVTFSIR